jgi:hypothetical protein
MVDFRPVRFGLEGFNDAELYVIAFKFKTTGVGIGTVGK